MKKSLEDLIAATSELAALPSTTVRLLDLLDDATVDAATVLDVVEKDPSLTANLLKLCNSAYYGLRRQVGSVREALVMLGNQTVLTLAFATSMGDILRGPLRAYRLEKHQLWHHSLATAVAASSLSAAAGRGARARAFTAGLVHDIGKLLLDRPLGGELQQLPHGRRADELLAAERSILGFDHATAGGALAEAWNFPDDLRAAIMGHHAPAHVATVRGETAQVGAAQNAVKTVAAANIIAAMAGLPGGMVGDPEDELIDRLAALDVDADTAQDLAARLPGELQNLLSLLGESA